MMGESDIRCHTFCLEDSDGLRAGSHEFLSISVDLVSLRIGHAANVR